MYHLPSAAQDLNEETVSPAFGRVRRGSIRPERDEVSTVPHETTSSEPASYVRTSTERDSDTDRQYSKQFLNSEFEDSAVEGDAIGGSQISEAEDVEGLGSVAPPSAALQNQGSWVMNQRNSHPLYTQRTASELAAREVRKRMKLGCAYCGVRLKQSVEYGTEMWRRMFGSIVDDDALKRLPEDTPSMHVDSPHQLVQRFGIVGACALLISSVIGCLDMFRMQLLPMSYLVQLLLVPAAFLSICQFSEGTSLNTGLTNWCFIMSLFIGRALWSLAIGSVALAHSYSPRFVQLAGSCLVCAGLLELGTLLLVNDNREHILLIGGADQISSSLFGGLQSDHRTTSASPPSESVLNYPDFEKGEVTVAGPSGPALPSSDSNSSRKGGEGRSPTLSRSRSGSAAGIHTTATFRSSKDLANVA